MEQILLISDAAKRVQVESHVLRYWEEELKLPIKRNEAGHRYYTNADIERFMQIKTMKERGLQLKAIKMILKDGKLDVIQDNELPYEMVQESHELAIDVVPKKGVALVEESKEEKARKLQWLLKQMIKETLQENNKELSKDIRESVVKELDYQFRCQEEREIERNSIRDKRNEEYYQRMDELLRKKSRKIRKAAAQNEKQEEAEMTWEALPTLELVKKDEAPQNTGAKEHKPLFGKKKRHLS